MTSTPIVDATRIFAARVCSENSIGDRALRKWIQRGVFPPPDGNLLGRNFWNAATYHQWLADVAAGKYRLARRPGNLRNPEAVTA
jgi:hypothetical protein